MEEKEREQAGHFWTISLDKNYRLIGIEFIGIDIEHDEADPTEILKVPLAKEAAFLVLVHSCATGEGRYNGCTNDLDRMMIRHSKALPLKIIDRVMITTSEYFSLAEIGMMFDLDDEWEWQWEDEPNEPEDLTTNMQLAYEDGGDNKAISIAMSMKERGYSTKEIGELTGLRPAYMKALFKEEDRDVFPF